MKKRILSILTLLCVVTALLPANITVFAATSGTCGDNLTWTLDDAGTLTISGTGDMDNQSPFERNNAIKTVIIEEGVTSLCWGAFEQCSNITLVELPTTLTEIKAYAFWWCDSLEHLEIPQNVTYIGPAIGGGTGYLHFDVDENNSMYCDVDGVIFTKDMKKIVAYAKDREQREYEIPNGVTIVGDKAFANCYGLKNITFPDTISEIEQEAFRNCSKLQNIEIPPKVTRLESQVFYDCDFTSIKIHKNINYVGAGALAANNELLIEVDSDNPNYCAVDGVLFNKDKTELVIFSKGSLQHSYTVPEGVTSILPCAFEWEYELRELTFPSTLTTFGYCAFQGCYGLKSIEIPDNVKTISRGLFQSCSALSNITLSKNITDIFGYAFDGCEALCTVNYSGNDIEWAKINIEDGNDELLKAKPQKKYYSIILIENTIGEKVITCLSNEKIKISDIEEKYMHKVTLYTDSAMKNEFDISTAITGNMTLYVKLGEKIQGTKTTVAADGKNFTIKPINIDNGNTVILALYNGDTFVEMQSKAYTGEDIPFTTDKAYTSAKVMVWSDLESMTPICDVEIVK